MYRRASGACAPAFAPVLVLLVAAFVALFSPAAQAGGSERILSFLADVRLEADGTVAVRETLQVRAAGEDIVHGIYQDFARVRAAGYGRERVGLTVTQVMQDGAPADWHTAREGEATRLYVGSADETVEPGLHTYRIDYRLTGLIDFFPGHDELNLNVTGNGWAFPIDRAELRLSLPAGGTITALAGYTGAAGGQGQDFTAARPAAGEAVVRTTRPLEPGEGLTVAVAFPKGVVAEPGPLARAVRIYLPAIIAIGGLGLVTAYYGVAWRRVGVDPPAGPVIPVYRPTLPPHAMRFIERTGYDSACLTAAVIDLAVKGHLRIEGQESGPPHLTRTEGGRRPPGEGEAVVLKFLFPEGGGSVDPARDQTRIARTGKALAGFLRGRFLRAFIVNNRVWFAAGAALTLAVWVATALVVADPAAVVAEAGGTALLTVGLLVAGGTALQSWRALFAGRFAALPAALVTSVLALAMTGVWLFTGLDLMLDVGLAASVALVAGVAVNLLFFRLLQRPTAAGRAALDEIAGTRLYLTVAEADRLKFHNPPDRTPAHFEEMLPYAVALGVETAWSAQFGAVLAGAAAGAAAAAMPQPGWYSGPGWGGDGWRNVGRGIGGSLASAELAGLRSLAAARAAASGSGAAFGGGFSGGGGGSSGGGGW